MRPGDVLRRAGQREKRGKQRRVERFARERRRHRRRSRLPGRKHLRHDQVAHAVVGECRERGLPDERGAGVRERERDQRYRGRRQRVPHAGAHCRALQYCGFRFASDAASRSGDAETGGMPCRIRTSCLRRSISAERYGRLPMGPSNLQRGLARIQRRIVPQPFVLLDDRAGQPFSGTHAGRQTLVAFRGREERLLPHHRLPGAHSLDRKAQAFRCRAAPPEFRGNPGI